MTIYSPDFKKSSIPLLSRKFEKLDINGDSTWTMTTTAYQQNSSIVKTAATNHNDSLNETGTTSSSTKTNWSKFNHLKSGFAGGIAGCLAKTLVSPLDRVKILFQTNSPDYSKYSGSLSGVFRAIGAIWEQSGFFGLVQGHSVTLFRIFPYAGIKFMSYDVFHKKLMPEPNSETPIRRFIAGASSGVMAVFLTYPLDIIRVRTAIEIHNSKLDRVKIRKVIKSIYSEKPINPSYWDSLLFQQLPITKFYKGFSPTICGMVPYAGTSFLVWGTLQSRLPVYLPNKIHDHVIVNLICGSIAGMVAQTVSYPLEIIRRKMQVGGSHHHKTMAQTAHNIFNTGGIKGFFVGLSIGYLKVIPMTAISFVTWSKLKLRFE